jgi:DNA-binding LytR/AlgR family response regulator
MRILIIEDEQPAARRLTKLLGEVEPSAEVVATLDSVSAAVAWFGALGGHGHPDKHPDTAPELAFMDIHLSDGLSFEIFQRAPVPCPVIFTTAYDEYSLRAFKVNSVDYLLKPIKADDLRRSVDKFKHLRTLYAPPTLAPASALAPASVPASVPAFAPNEHIESLVKSLLKQEPAYRSRFLLKRREDYLVVRTDDVAYLYSEHRLTHLVRRDGTRHIVEFTLDELERELHPQHFYRVNRQFLVHFEAIVGIHRFFDGKLKLSLDPAPKAVAPTLSATTISATSTNATSATSSSITEVIVGRDGAAAFKAWLDR